MSLITPYTGHPGLPPGGGLLSTAPAVQRRQVSRIKAYMKGDRFYAKKNRSLRKAMYKQKLQRSETDSDILRSLDANPMQYGGPRLFKIHLAGEEVFEQRKLHDPSFYEDEGHFVFFSALGIAGRAMRLDNTWIDAKDITISPDKNIYTVSTTDDQGKPLSMFLDFSTPETPTGQLSLSSGEYGLNLQPYATNFNVKISADSGAYYSSGQRTLVWDTDSSEWTNAKWEDGMGFAYDTVYRTDPFRGRIGTNEVAYTDPEAKETFSLTADGGIKYSAVMQGLDTGGSLFLILVDNPSDVPAPPEVRTASDIKSFFPQQSLFQFDGFGGSFTGAYMLPGTDTVYGVVGTAVTPWGDLAGANEKEKPAFVSRIKPIRHIFTSAGVSKADLDINGLTGLDPMQPDPSYPTGYRDVVSQAANSDFNNIITYYMDDDIRGTFVQAAPIQLADPTVRAIATDSPDNSTFYKTLQVPYVVASLSRSTLDEAKQANGLRAEAQLKHLPTDSPVYSRQSDALYRHRYLTQFPIIQQYLDDQQNGDYTTRIQEAAATLKQNIAQVAQAMGGADSHTAAKNLKAAQDDIDSLCAWATEKKLFWAFYLYYWCTTQYLPNLAAQVANGTTASNVSRKLKGFSATFGILEQSQQNPNGKSFQEAFNDMVRVYMMVSMIPQFVDADGQSEDFDSILKAMLEQFYEDNANSEDSNLVAEAKNAQFLAKNDFVRGRFFAGLVTSMRFGGTLGAWSNIVQRFNGFNESASWYKGLAGASSKAATFLRFGSVVLLVLCLIPAGGWKALNPQQKTLWVTVATALGVTFTLQAAAGFLRVYSLWSDLSGFVDSLKAFFGFRSVLQDLPAAAQQIESGLARWLIRTGPETMQISGQALTTPLKLFGRSVGEFLTNVVGSLLAAVNLVLSAIDVSKTTDPLQKTLDSMFIISSGLQLLAIGAGWLTSAGLVASEGAVAVLETAAACLGPLAIAFAAAGLIVFIVMLFLRPNPPNPVQDFLNNQADKAGLKMPYKTDIDYFNVVPPDKGAESLNGIAFQTGDAYLKLGGEATADQFAIQSSDKITYYPDTCWSVTTDYLGNTIIFTYALDASGNDIAVCLAQTSDGKLQAIPPPSKTTTDATGKVVPVDPDVYKKNLARQQWKCTCLSEATSTSRVVDGTKETFPLVAKFQISQGNKYLVGTESGSSWAVSLADSGDTWTLQLLTLGPAPFQYVQSDWSLTTDSRDESDMVIFSGPTSTPLQLSITPALPSFLELVESTETGGTIQQLAAVAPRLMSATIYTVTASIRLEGRTFSRQANVTISVLDPNVELDITEIRPTLGEIESIQESTMPDTSAALPMGTTTTEIRSRYETMMATAPAFFKWSQRAAVELSQHYTATVAISRMQKALMGHWLGGNFEPLFFPNPSPGPDIQSGDPCNYHDAASAYVAQAIGNGDGYARQFCNFGTSQTTINTFNTKLWNTNPDRYIEWLQWPGSTSTTGGPCSLQNYVNCILSPQWLAMKASEQASGLWSNPSMEMFCHFLKLAALGADDATIQSIYTKMTVNSDPAQVTIDPGSFSDITPSTWRSYRAYLLPGNIGTSQLNISDLNRTQQYKYYLVGAPIGGLVTVTSHADTAFLRDAGFYQSPPSGCCFRAETAVLMADGTYSAIETLKPGQMVSTISPTGAQPRQVAFVSRPQRSQRPLYAFRSMPDILFTATHPLNMGTDQYQSPILGFVDVNTALKANPLWAQFTLQAMPPENIIHFVPGTIEETLYDLIFYPDTNTQSGVQIPTYVVRSRSGEKLFVCSEAPDPDLMPRTAAFVVSFAKAISTLDNDVTTFFPDGLSAGVLDYTSRIKKHKATCAEAVVNDKITDKPAVDTSMSGALNIISKARLGPQILADSIEAIIGALGLSLEVLADNGWQQNQKVQNPDERRSVISTHLLELAQPASALPDADEKSAVKLPKFYGAALARLRDILLSPTATITVHMSGIPALESIPQALGPHMFRLRTNIDIPDTASAAQDLSCVLTISAGDRKTILTAKGNITNDTEARWPVYLASDHPFPGHAGVDRIDPEILFWHVGWLTISWCSGLSRKILRLADGWVHDERKAMTYLWLLGEKVGEDILRSILGPSG